MKTKIYEDLMTRLMFEIWKSFSIRATLSFDAWSQQESSRKIVHPYLELMHLLNRAGNEKSGICSQLINLQISEHCKLYINKLGDAIAFSRSETITH